MQTILEKHKEKGPKHGGEMEDFVDVLIAQADQNGDAIPDKDEFIKATTAVSVCTSPFQSNFDSTPCTFADYA